MRRFVAALAWLALLLAASNAWLPVVAFESEEDEEFPTDFDLGEGMDPGTDLTVIHDVEELQTFINPPHVIFGGGVVGIFSSENQQELVDFTEFTRPLDGNGFRVAVSVGAEPVMKHFGVKPNGWKIFVFPPPKFLSEAHGEKPKIRFGGIDIHSENGKTSLKDFILRSYLPLASQISPIVGNERLYVERMLPVFVVIAPLDEDKDPKGIVYLLNRLRKIGETHRSKMIFAILDKHDAENTLRFQKRFFVPDENKAENMERIVGIKDGKTYYTMQDTFSVETGLKFIDDFFAGKLEPASYQEDLIDDPNEIEPIDTDLIDDL